MSCPHGYSDGVYVLGALSPAERSAYESHLAECPECAGAVARLAPIPGLLGRIDPAVLRRPEPAARTEPVPAAETAGEPAQLTRLLQVVGEQRRRQVRTRRWQIAAAAVAAAVLAGAGAVGWQQLTEDPPAGGPVGAQAPEGMEHGGPMDPVAEDVPVTAEVRWTQTAAGTMVWLYCTYPGAGYEPGSHVFRLVAVGEDGYREQIGSWWAGPGEEVTMTGVTRLTGADLARLELRGYDDDHLLSYEMP